MNTLGQRAFLVSVPIDHQEEIVMKETPQEAAEAVYAIMQAVFGAPPLTVWQVCTSVEDYADRGRELEALGIALVDPYKGVRGRDLTTKVGVFISPKTVGLRLLRGHARYHSGNLSDYLKHIPGAERTSRTLCAKLTGGLLIPIETWMDATDMIDAQMIDAPPPASASPHEDILPIVPAA